MRMKVSLEHETKVSDSRSFHYGLITGKYGVYWACWSTFYGKPEMRSNQTMLDYEDCRKFTADRVRRWRRETKC